MCKIELERPRVLFSNASQGAGKLVVAWQRQTLWRPDYCLNQKFLIDHHFVVVFRAARKLTSVSDWLLRKNRNIARLRCTTSGRGASRATAILRPPGTTPLWVTN